MAERESESKKKEKTILRKQILKDRNALSSKQRDIWDKQILEHLIRYDHKKPCSVYLCYVNYQSEVSTKKFICWCLNRGKTVFVPKVFVKEEAKPTEMEFYQITAWDELKTGYRGILEPEDLPERAFTKWFAKIEKETVKPERLHLRMLLPGAVFDKAGNRIGYGGGFYDRWLAKWSRFDSADPKVLEKIGLAYSMQIVRTLPTERFDQKVDLMITEEFMA